MIGEDNDLSEDIFKAFIDRGGRALVLPQSGTSLPFGAAQKRVDSFHGSLDVPEWPEARGFSRSDLRWRTDAPAYLIGSGAEIGADGMLARKVIGKGVLIYCQLDPDRFDADVNTYFRFTRWRQMRALCQVLANLGARFEADELIFNMIPASATTNPWRFEPVQQPTGFYRSDYITDYEIGDDPYRYYNW